MNPVTVDIKIEVDPSTKPRIPPVVAFPGDKVRFSSENGVSTFFFPEGDQIFEGDGSRPFPVRPGDEAPTLTIKSVNALPFKDTIGSRGALFVEYAVSCKNDKGIYFAEGGSAPIIIIPRGLGG